MSDVDEERDISDLRLRLGDSEVIAVLAAHSSRTFSVLQSK